MTHKITALIASISFITFSTSAFAEEPPASLALNSADTLVEESTSEVSAPKTAALDIEVASAASETSANKLSRRVARRDYGLVGMGAVGGAGGMLLGFATGLPAVLIATDYDVGETGRRATFFATAGVVSAATTMTALRVADASWSTSLLAAGASLGTAAVGLGAATAFANNDKPYSLVAVYPLTILVAGAATAGAVALVNEKKVDVE